MSTNPTKPTKPTLRKDKMDESDEHYYLAKIDEIRNDAKMILSKVKTRKYLYMFTFYIIYSLIIIGAIIKFNFLMYDVFVILTFFVVIEILFGTYHFIDSEIKLLEVITRINFYLSQQNETFRPVNDLWEARVVFNSDLIDIVIRLPFLVRFHNEFIVEGMYV